MCCGLILKKPSLIKWAGFIQLMDPARLIRQEEALNRLSNEMKVAPFRCFLFLERCLFKMVKGSMASKKSRWFS